MKTQSDTTGNACFSVLGLINAGTGEKVLGFKIHTTHINKNSKQQYTRLYKERTTGIRKILR